MIKRVNHKKHLFPRFVDFMEGAKLAYDRLRFYFAANLTPYVRVTVCFCFFRKILLK